jgi:hypothetical protein
MFARALAVAGLFLIFTIELAFSAREPSQTFDEAYHLVIQDPYGGVLWPHRLYRIDAFDESKNGVR